MKFGYSIDVEPTYFISHALNVYVGVYLSRTPDWLVWQRDNLIGSFDGREARLRAGFNWTITNRQELRLKLQAIAVNADIRQGYRVDPAGTAVPTQETVEDFSVRNLGLQIRYRYEFAPLSYLYVVYGRGGYEDETAAGDFGPRAARHVPPARRRPVADQAQLSIRIVARCSPAQNAGRYSPAGVTTMNTKRRRIGWLILLLPLYAACSATYLGQSGKVGSSDWRTASREPVGLAPDPASTPEAVVQVYAARAIRWRGYFGVHTWIAVKPAAQISSRSTR